MHVFSSIAMYVLAAFAEIAGCLAYLLTKAEVEFAGRA
jgi:drug/metabolite transporter superfamily protein YnfA